MTQPSASPASARILRATRTSIACLVLLASLTPFLDLTARLPPAWIRAVTWPQVGPSLASLAGGLAWPAAGALVVLAATALFGRLYCSVICPLGIYQDAVWWFRRGVARAPRLAFSRPRTGLHLGILAFALLAAACGFTWLAGLLDPFSAFGRFTGTLLRPAVAEINNAASALGGLAGAYLLPSAVQQHTPFHAFAVILVGFAVVTGMAWARGRLFCNIVCPVGALLGLAARLAPFRIRISSEDCTGCSKCASACKAQCIDFKTRTVDASRCVACFDCLTACSRGGIRYSLPRARTPAQRPKPAPSVPPSGLTESGHARRALFLRILALPAAWLAGAAHARTREAGDPGASEGPVPGASSPGSGSGFGRGLGRGRGAGRHRPGPLPPRDPASPPGSRSVARFNSRCTACRLCVSVCPTHVLTPTFLEYGARGLFQPRLDFEAGFCNYECTRCGEVCPTGAILPLAMEAKKVTRVGAAKFVKFNCIVHSGLTDCGTCGEHCPTHAIAMVPWRGGLYLPEVNEEVCIGCGACEHVCPALPYKAIYVERLALHETADRPIPAPAPVLPAPPSSGFPF